MNYKGEKINGHEVLVLHHAVTEANKKAHPIHLDLMNKTITFTGDAFNAKTLVAASKILFGTPAPKKEEKKGKK